jgi:hypothetical protein
VTVRIGNPGDPTDVPISFGPGPREPERIALAYLGDVKRDAVRLRGALGEHPTADAELAGLFAEIDRIAAWLGGGR